MKILICTMCESEMEVPNNSGKKFCHECLPEHTRQKAMKFYKQNKENGKLLEYRKTSAIRRKKEYRTNPQKKLLISARSRASNQKMDFNLKKEDIYVPDVCPILKTPFKMNTYYTASIDRVDNEKGYVKGNVQVLSHKANAMKNSATNKELWMFAEWIINNIPKDDPTHFTHIAKLPNVPEISNGSE